MANICVPTDFGALFFGNITVELLVLHKLELQSKNPSKIWDILPCLIKIYVMNSVGLCCAADCMRTVSVCRTDDCVYTVGVCHTDDCVYTVSLCHTDDCVYCQCVSH